MRKLKAFLWIIVFVYLLYAIWRDGLQTELLVILVLAVFTLAMQIRMNRWKKKALRKKE
ncbi:hypothetical protein [Megasphaera vaginalis (ex Srinivasan et al. 2021)]|uniref:Uncharacterized protein n=1 Tax=Megasphaera vaginalis (ex Srinivasan et al. 2021) TaxID=1111454 RepID=U7UPK8_9FIRM|nr:hypothetical protein [Megasphaera vaginalis (ex Srinivasan et al. 2021)]ERT60418.1 hypothetical protein HMPREF1250_0311 [Megasphaera vaginalis (ex Srinivasan et al. 2021)]